MEPSPKFRDPCAASPQRRDHDALGYEIYCIEIWCAPSCELGYIKV
jgi:hypothetical protein